jgi:ATP-dependent helicase HrpA
MGRNVAALQAEFGGQARQSFQKLAEKAAVAVATETSQPASQAMAQESQAKEASAAAADYQNLTTWSFGELPELLEIQQGKQTLIGFPALVDKGAHCDLEVFDDPAEAARMHHAGLRRLFALQLREQLKYLEKNIPGLQQMGMQFMSLGTQEELRDQILQAALDRAVMQDPLPRNAEEFHRRKDEGKSRISLLANEIARLASQILAEYYSLPKKLQAAKAHAQSVADMQSQLQALVTKRFVTENDYTQLAHFPRYLKAIGIRLDKLRADPVRDQKLMAEWSQVAAPYQRALKGQKGADPKMTEFRWLLEELRVSLFAQELRTPMPVSVKRLQKVWESMQR